MSTIVKMNIVLALFLAVFVAIGYANQQESREELLQQEPITVDLGWSTPSQYHNQLASYAYRICKTKEWKEGVDYGEKYSCENQIKTRNSENGGRNSYATNTSNSNGTHDGGLCQLNSQYHKRFLNSKRYNNPLAQLEYCNEVRFDAFKKKKMPRYAYPIRHQRDKGITFDNNKTVTKVYAGKVEANETEAISYPDPDCLYMGTVGQGRKIQIDLHDKKGFVRILYEFIFGADEKGVAFNCKA